MTNPELPQPNPDEQKNQQPHSEGEQPSAHREDLFNLPGHEMLQSYELDGEAAFLKEEEGMPPLGSPDWKPTTLPTYGLGSPGNKPSALIPDNPPIPEDQLRRIKVRKGGQGGGGAGIPPTP
jgi:hypothetical protein